jgi:exodeoxyribonuclease III
MVKIATWNINSVRTRLESLVNWLRTTNPDIVLLQELKCQEGQFPYQQIEDLGYNIAISGQKSYNGVAILSKYIMEDIVTDFPHNPNSSEARYIEAVISTKPSITRVASIYVPNGQELGCEKFSYKLKFLDALYEHAKNLYKNEEIIVLGGDYNVAPFDIDVYDHKLLKGSVCFNIEEQIRFRKLLNCGYTDIYRKLNTKTTEFSWWDYRAGSWQHNKGMRIDHLLLSPEAADLAKKCYIDKHIRGESRSSDHAPVVVELDIQN